MPDPDSQLLEPRLLGRLERLQLATRRPLAGSLAGEHRSPRHGSSLDFADYREYHPGDDYRRIDYHLLARLDLLLIKLFEADDDITVRLLIDTSASMATGDKLLQAQRLAAALGFVGLVRRDVVTVASFPDGPPPRRFLGRLASGLLFEHLAGLSAAGPTAVEPAVRRHLAQPGPAGLTVLFSDLLTAEWERGLTRLRARGGDLVVVHVLDRADLEPDLYGDLDVVDRESRSRLAVSLTPSTIADYRAVAGRWVTDVATRCRQLGAAYVRVFADEDPEPVLLGAWRREGVMR